MHSFYVEITDEDGTVIAGTNCETTAEHVSYVEQQIKDRVVLGGDRVKLYNIYTLVDGQVCWDDLEMEYEILHNPDDGRWIPKRY